MDLAQKESSDTLPPASREASAEVAHFVMVECIEVESSFFRPDLNLLWAALKSRDVWHVASRIDAACGAV